MQVNVWKAMNDAIPRLQAQEYMDNFTVQTVANPYVDADARENILNAWRALIKGSWQTVPGTTQQKLVVEESSNVNRVEGLPLREVHRRILNAFGARGGITVE